MERTRGGRGGLFYIQPLSLLWLGLEATAGVATAPGADIMSGAGTLGGALSYSGLWAWSPSMSGMAEGLGSSGACEARNISATPCTAQKRDTASVRYNPNWDAFVKASI